MRRSRVPDATLEARIDHLVHHALFCRNLTASLSVRRFPQKFEAGGGKLPGYEVAIAELEVEHNYLLRARRYLEK